MSINWSFVCSSVEEEEGVVVEEEARGAEEEEAETGTEEEEVEAEAEEEEEAAEAATEEEEATGGSWSWFNRDATRRIRGCGVGPSNTSDSVRSSR